MVQDEATAADLAKLDLDALSRQVHRHHHCGSTDSDAERSHGPTLFQVAVYDVKSQLRVSNAAVFITGLTG